MWNLKFDEVLLYRNIKLCLSITMHIFFKYIAKYIVKHKHDENSRPAME